MRLVKAMLKKDLSTVRRAQCCEEYVRKIKADLDLQGVVTLDLDNYADDPICCAYCGEYFGLVHGVTFIKPVSENNGCLVPLDLFDLDEGGYEKPN